MPDNTNFLRLLFGSPAEQSALSKERQAQQTANVNKFLDPLRDIGARLTGAKPFYGADPIAFQTRGQYAQVRPNENISQFAKRTGLSVEQVSAFNGDIKTLPPVGTRLATQYNLQSHLNTEYGPQASAAQTVTPPTSNPSNYFANSMAPYNTAVPTPALTRAQKEQIERLTGQLERGQNPTSIPNALIGQMGFTASDLTSTGYVKQNEVWVYKGTAASGGAGGSSGNPDDRIGEADFEGTRFMQKNRQNNVSFLNQLRWDGKKYVKIGTLIRQGRLDVKKKGTQKVKETNMRRNKKGKLVPVSKGGGQPAAPAVSTNREGPTSVLDIHLGSG